MTNGAIIQDLKSIKPENSGNFSSSAFAAVDILPSPISLLGSQNTVYTVYNVDSRTDIIALDIGSRDDVLRTYREDNIIGGIGSPGLYDNAVQSEIPDIHSVHTICKMDTPNGHDKRSTLSLSNIVTAPISCLISEVNYSIPSRGETPDLHVGNTGHDRCNFMFWNVAGLRCKVTNRLWNDFIQKFEVISLQETWATEPIYINSYKTLHTPAIASRHGRAKGGLCTYVSNLVNFGKINIIAEDCFYQIISLPVDKSLTVILVNYYNNVPHNLIEGIVKAIRCHLQTLQESGNNDLLIVWGGDFNSVLWQQSDTGNCGIMYDMDMIFPHFPHSMYGESLNEIVFELDLGYANTLCIPPCFIWPYF